MFERFSRSWALVQASGTVLRQDEELLVFPLCSAIATLVIGASFAWPLFAGDLLERLDDTQGIPPQLMLLGFAFYLAMYFVVFFFNTALVGAAMIRLNGGDPTVSDGLRIASAKLVPILGYAGIAATVGLILRVIEERAGFVGRWVAGLLGVAFTAATFLTAPVLVSRDVGPFEAVRESAQLLRKTWGENIIGNGGVGLIFFLIYMITAGIGSVFIYLAAQSGSTVLTVAMIGVLIAALIALALVHSALQGVYSAALYRYATTGDAGAAFPGALLNTAFKPKR